MDRQIKPEGNGRRWPQLQRKLFRMVSVGVVDEPVNQLYDILSTGALVVNLLAGVLSTFSEVNARFGGLFLTVERVTVFFFLIDYVLRILTAKYLYPQKSEPRAIAGYMVSFSGIVDLLSFLPYYLPVFFPAGAVAFRMFRVARILRLFRINAYYDSLNVITEVLSSKKQQLLSSVFIILVLMLGASMCMYSLENKAQPDVFENAFSGIWWAASTLLTVGYGDIYPVTSLGRLFGTIIAFLGVGMVAIPTGIISAGFVEQYSRLKQMGSHGNRESLRFIKVALAAGDTWCGRELGSLHLPKGLLVAAVQRDEEILIPRGNMTLLPGDRLILGAKTNREESPVRLQEVTLGENHPWQGTAVRDLDISRKTLVVKVRRGEKLLVPSDDLKLQKGDTVLLYGKAPGSTEEWEV